jgi:hypothetical protein
MVLSGHYSLLGIGTTRQVEVSRNVLSHRLRRALRIVDPKVVREGEIPFRVELVGRIGRDESFARVGDVALSRLRGEPHIEVSLKIQTRVLRGFGLLLVIVKERTEREPPVASRRPGWTRHPRSMLTLSGSHP